MTNLLLIGLGGAVGTLLRYGVTVTVSHALPRFPYGTLTVNVVGCLLIGLLGRLFTDNAAVPEAWRLAIIFGVLGGFTTFSSFGYDTLKLMQDGRATTAIINVVLSNGLGLAAVVLGYWAAKPWAKI